MSFKHIDYGVVDRIATIRLNRPDKLNAFTDTMMSELREAFDLVDADDEVRAVIVTGAGRAFCAGADLSAGADTFNYGEADTADGANVRRDGGGTVTLRVFSCHKPVIAAINGPAVGVGATMILPMDVRLASTTAKFGFVFTRRGVVPEACSAWFLPRVVGISRAQEWVLTGRVFDAEEALEHGLVRSVHRPDQLLTAAHEIAREIADNTAPVSVALARQMMWRMLGAAHPMEAHRIDSRGIQIRGRSKDVAEGVMSFLEKRPPRFVETVSQDLPDIFPDWEEPEFH